MKNKSKQPELFDSIWLINWKGVFFNVLRRRQWKYLTIYKQEAIEVPIINHFKLIRQPHRFKVTAQFVQLASNSFGSRLKRSTYADGLSYNIFYGWVFNHFNGYASLRRFERFGFCCVLHSFGCSNLTKVPFYAVNQSCVASVKIKLNVVNTQVFNRDVYILPVICCFIFVNVILENNYSASSWSKWISINVSFNCCFQLQISLHKRCIGIIEWDFVLFQ